MATLRDLKKRLNSVKTTGQLAGAMKTVSAAKFSKIGSVTKDYNAYARICETLSGKSSSFASSAKENAEQKRLYVVLSGNRGLCGGYNSELFSLFSEEISACEVPYKVIACGKSSVNYCKEKHIDQKEFVFSDIPLPAQSRELSDYLIEEWEKGSVNEVYAVYQHSVNTLTHIPTVKKILPAESSDKSDTDEILYVPDKATVAAVLEKYCFETQIHSLVLECALGAQAATLLAMRSAYDNAEKTTLSLETAINRRRQADVTSSVIETSPMLTEE